MRENSCFLFMRFAALTITAFAVLSGRADSQATLDRFLSTVEVSSSNGCSTIRIHLNRPASYLSHSPASSGTEMEIRVQPLATMSPSDSSLDLKEAASVAPNNAAGLAAVYFDPSATSGPVIRLDFAKLTAFRLKVDKDSRLLRVDASAPRDAAKCLGSVTSSSGPEVQSNQEGKTDGPRTSDDGASSLKAGKALLASGDFNRAVLFFTKAVTIGTGRVKQDAQEMLGLAHERAGQLAHAKAEYEAYLELYPNGQDAVRVRDRLSGVSATMESDAEKQFASRQLKSGKVAIPPRLRLGEQGDEQKLPDQPGKDAGKSSSAENQGGVLVSNNGTKVNFGEVTKDPNAWTWEKNGSVGQYYYRDDNFSASDPSNNTLDRHQAFQNELISSGDLYLSGENQNFRTEFRTSMFNETGFGEQRQTRSTSVGSIYVDGLSKDTGISARIGRQSRSTGGVFGRFDGVLAGWQADKSLKFQAVAGSPVYSRATKPFADDRYFYGASVDYSFPGDKWAGEIYAIEQDVKDVIDRRALGAELRYAGANKTLYTAGDYDLFYNELNNAYISGTWNLSGGSSVYATADFRRVPFLLTSNALVGQMETKLSSLVDIFGEDTVEQMAVDRTATAATLSVGGAHQLNEDWQLAIDGTIADYSGTPASGGVDEVPDPGIEYYASAQLTGSNLFKENDALTMALRYSDSQTSSMYMADIFGRYPITDNIRVSPRLRLSIRDAKNTDSVQYLIMPSVGTRYHLNKNWNFELEVGARLEEVLTGADERWSLDVLATAGFRYEF